MANYLAGLYEQRGGDDQLRKRHAQLIQWASEDGVLDQARKSAIPERLSGAFARLTDFFSREEFAVAGVWDVLSGTADEGDTVGGRFARELLGGTKLGNLIGVEDRRAKESFADVLEQRGVGEGGRLSDVIGQNALTKYFDPTARGTAGLAMSVMFSPSTYLTMGAGNAVKWVGKAGKVARVSKEAQLLAETTYKSKILKAAEGIPELEDALKAGDFVKMEAGVLSRKAGDSGLRAMNELNHIRISEQLREEAMQEVADLALTTRPDLRRTFGLRFAGVQVANLEPLGELGARLLQTARTGKVTAPAMQLIDKGISGLDKVFQRVPFGARKHEAFRRFEARRHAMRQSSEQMADELLFGSGGVMTRESAKKLTQSLEANKALAFALDAGRMAPEDPQALATWTAKRQRWIDEAAKLGIGDKEAVQIADNWLAVADNMGAVAVDYGMILEDSYLRFNGRFIPRKYTKEFTNERGKITRLGTTGGSMGEYALMREYDTLDEFVERTAALGLDIDKAIEWNVPKLMHDYMSTHIRAVADAEMVLDTTNLLSPSWQTVFKSLSKNLQTFKVEPTSKELDIITEALARNEFLVGERALKAEATLQARRLTEGLPEADALRWISAEVDKLAADAGEAGVGRLRTEVTKDVISAQRAARGEEISGLIAERSDTILRMKEVRQLRNLAKANIEAMTETEIKRLGIEKVAAEINAIRKTIEGIKKTKGLEDISTTRLSQQISDNIMRLLRLEDAMADALRAPKANLQKAIDQLDELEATRRAINEDIEFWRTSKLLAQVELDSAMDAMKSARARHKEIKADLAAGRILQREAEKLLNEAVVHPRDVLAMDRAAIKAMRPELRAAYLYEVAAQAGTLEKLDIFFKMHEDLIAGIDPSVFAEMRRAAGSRRFDGMREITLAHGPMRGKPFAVPEGVADFFQRNETQLRTRLPEEVESLLKKFDILQNTFKRTHTILFPSFHVRNIISTTAAIAVETNVLALMDKEILENTIRTMTNWGDEFTMVAANGRRYTNQELRKLMISLDIIPERMALDELTGEGQELLARIKVLRNLDRAVGSTGQNIENLMRGLYFMSELKRGVHPMDAAMKIKQVVFDYSDLSFTQREVIRRLFPFATWTMKNVELQVKNLLTKPGRVGAIVRTGSLAEQGPEADLLPEYMRGEMKVKLTDQPGKAGTFLTGIDLPINNIDVLWAGGVGKTMREQFAMFTPIIKAPLEYMLNLDTFTGQPIRGRQWLGQMGPVIERSWPKKLQEFIELEPVPAEDGRTLYKANGTKMWLITKNIFLGRLFNESVNAAGMAAELADGNVDEGMKMMVRTLTGMRFNEMDLTDAQKQKLTAEIRAIEKYLVERGSVSEFTRTFRPQSKQRQPMGFFP